jgi:lysophospholipase L1-like esterase
MMRTSSAPAAIPALHNKKGDEMNIFHARQLAVAFFLATWSVASAGEDVQPVPALKAEIQTAEWAQSWWMPRHKEKLAERKSRQHIDLIMIGDSIIHGWEAGGRKVWDRYYAKRHAMNLGFSGDRTEQVIWRLEHGEIDDISPKLAVVMIGTNNAGHRQDKPEDTAAGVKAIIEQLRKRLPKTKILLLAIFPRGPDANDPLRKLNEATNRILAGYADKKHVFYLDINAAFLVDHGELPKSIMPDLLHPNEKGYEIWAKAMEPMVKKLMGEGGT